MNELNNIEKKFFEFRAPLKTTQINKKAKFR